MSDYVLLVDDDPVLRDLCQEIFQQQKQYLNITLVTKSDGQKAMEYLNDRLDDCRLIITDYWLNGMNGAELVDSIREVGYTGPIVVSSGTSWEEIKSSFRGDVVEYLAKPFRLDPLVQMVEKLTSDD